MKKNLSVLSLFTLVLGETKKEANFNYVMLYNNLVIYKNLNDHTITFQRENN